MTDSGKHNALRQTSDGSFELIVEHGLQEASEEVSVAEMVATQQAAAAEPPSRRVLAIGAVALVVLGIVGVVAFVMMGPSESDEDGSGEVAGFRPYGGGAEPEDRTPSATEKKAVKAALAELGDDGEEGAPPEPPAKEITESEDGWELTEADEVVPEDEIEVVEVEPVPVSVEDEPVEVEEVEEDEPDSGNPRVLESEPGTMPRNLTGRQGLKALRGKAFGRDMTRPRLPQLNGNPLDTSRRMKELPIRNLQVEDDDGPVDEVVEDEVVEEETEEYE